jgi:hypothetical protein
VNDKVYVTTGIEGFYNIFGRVVPSLGITDHGKADCFFALHFVFYQLDVFVGQFSFSCNMYIVWMGFQHVTATETEGQQDKE